MRFLGILALSAGITACATSQTATPDTGADAATLEAYHWQLREVRNAQGQPQSGWTLPPAPAAAGVAPPDGARTVVLNFAQNQVSVGRLCNALGASYSLQGNALHIGPVRGTLMACPDSAAMVLEQQVGQRLPQASQWRIATPAPQAGSTPTPVLTLVFSDGGQWVLEGAPTNATRYGSAGERMFLEVAPQRVACSHPLIPNYQCLQVRKIEYDGQGLKTRVGEWENWYGDIQGYTHQPGVRNVLRIQRYPVANPPADAPAFAYVLDMTVESEIVR
ncbi:META and DUF4377 domain-containing protein [Acidovorax sp. CCYZU-2555]|uniref:META and DUF4377 domain-containing protein n=1 Tax=Acidovorax sp. CCYZU-2555 TaxID=2835042 RepID=UPI001BCDC219|nr:META and DUF4377 domain-containing protein [Acidovorax sp. CCYZU-2555]MBS7779637.1 META and DUF4377 domain-containing protein [Acidovorax sp. CCYZU-2555]